MIEKIAANLFKIEIPLPSGELQSINSYIIKSDNRNLLIDTGLGTDECVNNMMKNLKELGADLKKTDFFITHCHRDHFGLVPKLIKQGSIIYIDKLEAEIIDVLNSGGIEEEITGFITVSGFPEKKIENIFPSLPGRETKHRASPLPFKFLEDGDIIDIGDYHFKCIKTPGHSKGHVCLYEPRKKIFVSGDHLLGNITPGIQGRFNDEDPLSDYLLSLEKISKLDIEIVLPGHQNIFRNCKERITELKIHHDRRIQEVVKILHDGKKNAYETASRMSWDINRDSWKSFPLIQQFFATGEAFAHLKFLAKKNIIKQETSGPILIYSLNDK
jgi:glyoxylase-like metal-dependent hydrolase (beta-lactamase superfamily II)